MKDFMFLTKEFDNFVIFYFNGYLNKSLKESEIRDRMDLIFKKGCNRFIMNFGDTNLINSVGVSILMGIVDSIIKNKRRLAFSNLSKTNFEIFEIVGLSKKVKIFKRENEAIKYILGNEDEKP